MRRQFHARRIVTFLTGASGFLGGHVARLLVEEGRSVRALVRPSSDLGGLADLAIETVTGDLGDPASLAAALEGCRELFHVAADYRLWAPNPAEIYASNVEGTRNILQAARDAGVERVVYTSTVGCIGVPGNGDPGDEDRAVALSEMEGPYKRSKYLAEQAALEFATEGFPVVIVNPTAPVGEGDRKPTPTGQIIVDFLRGAMPAYLDTGLNIVDVRDVARGHLAAMEHGVSGERYILGGRNTTLREIFNALSKISGRPAPKIRIPYAAAYAYGAVSTAAARLTGRPPRAPLDAVRMARKKMFIRSAKAEREIGFSPGRVEEALERAIRWFRNNRYC